MSLTKRSIDVQQKQKAPPTDSISTHFLELSSTLANTTNMSRRSMACGKSLKKIPKVISSLEKNIQTLKKYCTEMSRQRPSKGSRNPISKQPNHNDSKNAALQRSSGSIDIDWVRNAYTTSYGHSTNNLVELYEFYRNHLEKSVISNNNTGSFSHSNNSTSIVRFACTSSISGRDDSKSSQSRQTPSLVSKEEEQSQHIPLKGFRRVSERQTSKHTEEHDAPLNNDSLNEDERRGANIHNSSVGNGCALRTKTTSNYYNCPARKNEDMPLAKHQLSNSHDNPPSFRSKESERKKRDPGNMPLQQKILRIETETDREVERPKARNEVKKFELNLAAELYHSEKQAAPEVHEVPHRPPKPPQQHKEKPTVIQQKPQIAEKHDKMASILSSTLGVKAQIHLQRSSMPVAGSGLNIYTINSVAPPAKPLQAWSRPATGTPHVASAVYQPVAPKRFINQAPSKSVDKEDAERKDDFDSWMIYEKNMLINKRKQEINSKLRQKEKLVGALDEEQIRPPASLDEAILLQPISPIDSGVGKANEPGLFDQALELNKDKLPLSKHDLSLWQNMNLVEEMHQNGQLSHLNTNKNCKENIIAPVLEMVKKKKSFKKSKFYVEDIPLPKKSSRQVQLIDIEGMSPQTLKIPERQKKLKKSANKDDSLLGCDISIGERVNDPLLNEIQSIQFDL